MGPILPREKRVNISLGQIKREGPQGSVKVGTKCMQLLPKPSTRRVAIQLLSEPLEEGVEITALT